jgi:hypothetical protein
MPVLRWRARPTEISSRKCAGNVIINYLGTSVHVLVFDKIVLFLQNGEMVELEEQGQKTPK